MRQKTYWQRKTTGETVGFIFVNIIHVVPSMVTFQQSAIFMEYPNFRHHIGSESIFIVCHLAFAGKISQLAMAYHSALNKQFLSLQGINSGLCFSLVVFCLSVFYLWPKLIICNKIDKILRRKPTIVISIAYWRNIALSYLQGFLGHSGEILSRIYLLVSNIYLTF